jgi:hypothetical protein
MILRPSVAVAFVFGLLASAALAESGAGYSRAAYATPVCPAGADAQNCLDNAYRAIDDLERRVSMLETGRRASSFASAQGAALPAAAGQAHIENTSTGVSGLSAIFHHPDCLPGWGWNGTTCVRREDD